MATSQKFNNNPKNSHDNYNTSFKSEINYSNISIKKNKFWSTEPENRIQKPL